MYFTMASRIQHFISIWAPWGSMALTVGRKWRCKGKEEVATVAHNCNPSVLGGWGRRVLGVRLAWLWSKTPKFSKPNRTNPKTKAWKIQGSIWVHKHMDPCISCIFCIYFIIYGSLNQNSYFSLKPNNFISELIYKNKRSHFARKFWR